MLRNELILLKTFLITSKMMLFLKFMITTILVTVFLVLISPLIFFLAVYRLVANLCLRWRILAPMDIFWDLDKDADLPVGIITCLSVVTGGKLTLSEFRSLFKQGKNNYSLDPKFQFLRKRSVFGYQYWQKNENFNLDDHVKGLRNDEVVGEDEMRQILEKLNDEKLPCNNQAQWDIHLGPQLKSKDGIHHTVICRFHHSLGDGPAIFRTAMQVFVKREEVMVREEKVKKYLQNQPAQGSFYQKMEDIKTTCSKIIMAPDENSFLHEISRLDGHMQISWRCSGEMLKVAKAIRKSTGASFSAALVASLLDALAQYRQYADTSKGVTLEFPFQVKYEQKPKLANNFTYNYATFTMPDEGRDTLAHLMAVDQCLQKSKSMAVLTINGLLLRAIAWLCPRPLIKVLTATKNVQIDFSNIPGPEVDFIYENFKLDQIIAWQPRIADRAIGVTMCSYRGVLSVGLNVDTAICKGPNDAEEIMHLWETQLSQMAQDLAQVPNNDNEHCIVIL